MKRILLKNSAKAAIFALFATAFACSSDTGKTEKLEGTSWKLQEMTTADGAELAPQKDIPTLVFGDSMRLSGYAGCNSFFGNYLQEKSSLTLNVLGATLRLCPDIEIEDAFLKNLAQVRKFGIEKDSLLYLSDSLNVRLCTFVRNND